MVDGNRHAFISSKKYDVGVPTLPCGYKDFGGLNSIRLFVIIESTKKKKKKNRKNFNI